MPQAQSPNINPSVTAFKPRQVLLLSKQQNMKQRKGSSSSPKTQENGSNTHSSDQNVLLLNSVFLYLQRHGFSKTLKSFRSEANIESGGLECCSLDLEEMCHQYLKSCNHAGKVFKSQERDLKMDVTLKDDGECTHVASAETNGKKKKKRSEGSDSRAVDGIEAANEVSKVKNSDETCTNNLVPELEIKSKEKKKRKQISYFFGHGIEQLSPEAVKACDDNIVGKLQLDDSSKKCKGKRKKKSKLVFESLDYNVDHHQLEPLPEVTEEKSKDLAPSEGKSMTEHETNIKSKENKKKNRKTSNFLGLNVKQHGLEDKKEAIGTQVKDFEGSRDSHIDNAAAMNTLDTLLEENGKSKVKRKSKSLDLEGLCDRHEAEFDKEKSKRIYSEKVDFQNSEENISKKEVKCSKKRKQLAYEENDYLPIDEVNPGELKGRNIESEKEVNESGHITMINGFSVSVGFTGKETKEENDQSQKTSEKQLHTRGNGIFDNNRGEKSSSQKTAKKLHNGSVEPKSVNAFQRVKIDEDGAEIGYGAKAQEVLGQVRGRDFRHEKTKKKRGSYRGGQIDLQSRSVKFNYSDED
ncbi:suppressor protein SRP40 [Malania oleifera]|uniref:suppressor protein SRP40 n=1 Tax=Malania oleifera TaxID=397392 RepID=UPI0025AE5D30|nr:suppressor protein SRP40 [Malania oleifera]